MVPLMPAAATGDADRNNKRGSNSSKASNFLEISARAISSDPSVTIAAPVKPYFGMTIMLPPVLTKRLNKLIFQNVLWAFRATLANPIAAFKKEM